MINSQRLGPVYYGVALWIMWWFYRLGLSIFDFMFFPQRWGGGWWNHTLNSSILFAVLDFMGWFASFVGVGIRFCMSSCFVANVFLVIFYRRRVTEHKGVSEGHSCCYWTVLQMASRVDTDDDTDNKGSMWVLDQKLDQPMDEEAGRLRNMYREKVRCNSS